MRAALQWRFFTRTIKIIYIIKAITQTIIEAIIEPAEHRHSLESRSSCWSAFHPEPSEDLQVLSILHFQLVDFLIQVSSLLF